MNPRLDATLLVTLGVGLGACHSTAPDTDVGFSRVLQDQPVFRKPEYSHARWGIHVEDLATGEVLISRNRDRLFAPASTTKLFSVAAALEELGAEHRFVTSIYRTGAITANGALDGVLILRPTGDLTLGGRDDGKGGIAFGNSDHIYANGNPLTELTPASPLAGLEMLARSVKAAGIASVYDVIIDDRLFDRTESTGSGPQAVTPIVINDNLVDFVITPTTPGEPARVTYRPRSRHYVVESGVRTTSSGEYRVRITSPRPDTFVLTGTIPRRHPPQVEVHEVADAAANARRVLLEELDRVGVRCAADPGGPNPRHLLPPTCDGLPEVAQLTSPPFAHQARLILKVSHNLHASTLPMLLAARRGKRDLLAGLRIQGELLARLGVNVQQISFGGAAGGARADMTTPRVTVQLLRRISERNYYEAFRRALPILGVDGTLFQIGTASPARGKVQAKTGTYYVFDAMNNRRLLTSKALAGYLTAVSGRQLAFCIVVNDVFLSDTVTTKSIHDDLGAIATEVYQAY